MSQAMWINRGRYFAAHGTDPRGTGFWAFSFQMADGTWSDPWFVPGGPMLYSKAKAAAWTESGKRRGARQIRVEP
jgi:hypothetical protein